MFCSVCGNKNGDNSAFCAKCGNKLENMQANKKYDEAVEHLKFEGYEILNNNKEKKDNKKEKVLINEKVENKPIKNKAELEKPKVDLEFNNKNNNRNYNNNMGEVVISTRQKQKNIVPIIICSIVLGLLVIGGIVGLLYYFLA